MMFCFALAGLLGFAAGAACATLACIYVVRLYFEGLLKHLKDNAPILADDDEEGGAE